FALVGARRIEKVAGFRDAWDGAGQLEVGAAKENIVAGRWARRQALGAPSGLQPDIDPVGQPFRTLARLRRDQPHTEEYHGQHRTPSAQLEWKLLEMQRTSCLPTIKTK